MQRTITQGQPDTPTKIFEVAVSAVPDGSAIVAFTPASISEVALSSCFENVARSHPGAKVHCGPGTIPETEGGATTYTFGTIGVLRFAAPVDIATLRGAHAALVRELAAVLEFKVLALSP